MTDTPNLHLPYVMAAQAQKHVTHNEAIRALDAIVQIAVADRDLAAPPGSPAEGDRYIVAVGASGAWAGKDNQVAAWQDGAWMLYAPAEGWLAWVADEDVLAAWDGAAWVAAGGGVNPAPLVGVNATADATNRLSVSSPASLFNHDGAGHQHKINKSAPADTASVLFQTGFSGRAELGTAGDDDWHVKVSPDGSTWHEAIVVDKDTGRVGFGTAAPGSVVEIDGVGKAVGGLTIGVDDTRNVFQYKKTDGTNLLRAMWDGSNMHHYLDGNVHFNLNGGRFTFDGNATGSPAVAVRNNAYFSLNSLTTGAPGSANIWAGPNAYATVGDPLTTVSPFAISTWAWNGSDGSSITSRSSIGQAQQSAANGDARLYVKNHASSEVFALDLPTGRLSTAGPVQVPSHTVAGLPGADTSGAGAIVYVSDETGGAVLAFSDGTDWRRVTDRAVVS